MDIEQYSFFNYASVFAIVSFMSVAVITIVYKLKLRWPTTANCWFCNSNTKLYHTELDWWRCPSCEQYNGFTKDGDYAYDIPEQRTEPSNNLARLTTTRHVISNYKNSLCDGCNRNQELKIFELQTFEPKGFFSSGIEEFKHQLELKYPLCESCSRMIGDVLRKQSLWLLQQKMQSFKAKSVKAIAHNANKLDKIVRFFLTVVSSALMYYPSYRPLPFLGMFLQSSAFIINQAHKSKNVILLLLWICIGVVSSRNDIKFLDLRSGKNWLNFENLTEYHLVIVLSMIIGLTNVTARYRKAQCMNASFKKLESPAGKQNSPVSSIGNDSFQDITSNHDTSKPNEYCSYRQSTNNFTESIKSSIPSENSSQMKFTAFTDNPRKHQNKQSTPSTFITNGTSSDIDEPNRRHELKFDGNNELYSLVDSLNTLKTLTLGNTNLRKSSQIPKVFETRVYGLTSPDLFQRSIKPNARRRFVLAPPKLKSVAQSSWVAGGYWQFGVDPPSLSRSSSQSSGFGSAGSNFAPSREPSVHNDQDKCSVMSEINHFCCPPRPNSVNSMSSRFHRVSPIDFTNRDIPFYNGPPQKLSQNGHAVKNSQMHFSPVHPEMESIYDRGSSMKSESLNTFVNEKTLQVPDRHNVNYPAVFTSPVWLSILLCGSLVFNIAVFCTILLR